uniref:GATA zinc finger containing protein n=1 Tax=Solanum tuberosum TaxID=4113 RepID=M1C735_SOLTU
MCTNVHLLFGEADKDPHLNPVSVPRRKRSKLRQCILSPAQIQRTLDNNLQAPDFEIISDGDEPVTLIYARNKYIPPNEVGLGAMLLVSPTTTTERLTPLSAMAVPPNEIGHEPMLLVSPTTTIERSTPQLAMEEDTVSCSMDQYIQPDLNWNHSEPDFMGKQGPCCHCGIEQTPLWRPGPTAKPVLCNACGLRWQTKETLDDYLPKHASTELPSEMKLEVGEEVSGQDGSSACLEEEMINISSLGSAGSSPDKCMQMEETNVSSVLLDGIFRHVNSEVYNACLPTSLRNNNVLEYVAMQNETTGNKDGNENACDNGLAPHHMDTTERA